MPASFGGRHCTGGRDHGHESSRGRDFEVDSQTGVQERHEEHTSADSQQRPQTSGDGAGDDDHRDNDEAHQEWLQARTGGVYDPADPGDFIACSSGSSMKGSRRRPF